MNDRREDFLRAELHRAAAEHEPDRTAMLNRIAARRPAPARRPRGRAWRMAGSAAAVAAVLGLGGVTRWTLAGEGDHDAQPVPPATQQSVPTTAATPTPTRTTPTPTRTTRTPTPAPPTTPPATRPTSEPAKTPSGKVPKGRPGNTRIEQGPVWSDGSIDPASTETLSLSNVTVKLREPATALDVTIRVALTPGLLDQGATHDATKAAIGSTVLHQPDALVYHFILAKGTTLPAGTYVFTARYAHQKGGRDAGADTYEAAATARGRKLDVYGDFYPTK